MRWLRYLSPAYLRDLERKVAAIPSQRRAIKSLVESIGRQAPAGSETELRGMVVLLDGRVKALEVSAGLALIELRRGRTSHAESVLAAILDSAPVDQREAS